MGNQVFTDQKTFSLDDIRRTKEEFCGRRALSENAPLILRSTQQAFDSFEHNIKAFSFRLGNPSASSGEGPADATSLNANAVMRRSNVVCQSMSLRDRVVVDPSCAYLVLHVKRTDTKQLVPSRNAPVVDSVPQWAGDSFAAFTPRGLATPFGIDIAAVRWRGRSSEERFRFEYSLHVYNGRASHQLVVAVATMQAFQIEKLLMNDTELLQRLFYGFNASRPSDLALPVSVGTLDFSDPRLDLSRRSAGPLNAVLQHHALLRNLYSVPLDTSPSMGSSSPQPAAAATATSSASDSTQSTPAKTSDTAAAVAIAAASSTAVPTPIVTAVVPKISLSGLRAAQDDEQQQQQQPPRVVSTKLSLPLGTRLHSNERDEDAAADEVPPVNRRSPQQQPLHIQLSQPPKLNLSGVASKLKLPVEAAAASRSNPTTTTSAAAEDEAEEPAHLAATQSAPTTEGAEGDSIDEVEETRKKLIKLREQAPIATEVLPYLFVGGEEAAKDRTQLLEKGITNVVNAAAHAIPNFHSDVFEYMTLYLCDSPDEPIFALFPLVNRFIEEARTRGGKTFIHCHQGVSRSCSLVIAFVMWKMGLCYDRAFEFTRERRKVCSPNSGFYVNLLRWEKQLSSPPRQQCWAYVPFTKEFTFPFVLREVVPQSSTEPFLFDSRVMYALLVPSAEDGDSDSGTVHLLRGSECSDSFSAAAFAALEAHLKYNFYTTGLSKTSQNNKGETITFSSSTLMRKRIVELSTNNPRARGIVSTALESHPPVAFQRDPSLNGLFQNDLPQLLEQHMDEVQQVVDTTNDRKRRREECLQALHSSSGDHPTTTGSPSHRTQTAWGASGTQQKQPQSSTTGRSSEDEHALDASHEDTAADDDHNDSQQQREASTSPSNHPLLVSGDESEPEGNDSVLVFEYPFEDATPVDVAVIDDLETEKGYAIVLRGYRGAGVAPANRKPHKVFLWLGEEFTKSEETLEDAFRHSAMEGALASVKITSRTSVGSIEDTNIVFERDEPTELLLAFA